MPLLKPKAWKAQTQYDETRYEAEGELVTFASLGNNVDAEETCEGATNEQSDGRGAQSAEGQTRFAQLLEPRRRGFSGRERRFSGRDGEHSGVLVDFEWRWWRFCGRLIVDGRDNGGIARNQRSG